MLIKEKNRIIAAILAFSGTITIPGLHKFYLGQPLWGIVYVLLCWTPI
ncbi:MAG: TM2 domain-containing protein, partial [Dolichospermum sp.]